MTHTTTFNNSHYLYNTQVADHDRITGEAILRAICACGSAFIIRHENRTPAEKIAAHAEMAARL